MPILAFTRGPMELNDAIRSRHSIRAYRDAPVEPEKLEAVLKAAAQAPSAGNLQAFQIHVVRDEATRAALANAAQGQVFLAQAPIVLVFCADFTRAEKFGRQREKYYSTQDAIIAMTYAQLAATDQGLGSCWVGSIDESRTARIMNLPDTHRPVALLPIGHADEEPAESEVRPLADLVVDLGK